MSDVFTLDSEETRERLASLIARLSVGNGEQWEVTVQRKRPNRTNQQLKTYWRWMRLVADKTGTSPVEADYAIRLKYAPEQVNLDGSDQTIPGDVSKYDTVRYAEFLDWVYEWAWSQLGLDLSCIRPPAVATTVIPPMVDFSDIPEWQAPEERISL